MKRSWIITSAFIGLVAFANAAQARGPDKSGRDGASLTAAQVEAMLQAKGFRNIEDVEFRNGMWQAEADSGDGKDLDLRIDPSSGRIYGEQGASRLREDDVRAALAAQGYSKVHDIRFEDGLWEADAQNEAGRDVEVRVDPVDGRLVSREND